MTDSIVDIHVPLVPLPDALEGDDPFPWIASVDDYLAGLDGSRGEPVDDGDEWVNEAGEAEYLFTVGDATEPELLTIARAVAGVPGVPAGVYVTVREGDDDDLGEGRLVDLDV